MSDFLLAIPARFGSSRFRGKVLAKLGGKPVIEHVYRACLQTGLGSVIIATESQDVVRACEAFGATAVLTSDKCQSGTDRIFEVSQNRPEKFIINIQGDEPFIQPSTILKIADLLRRDPSCDIATAVVPTLDEEKINNPNCVKAVLTEGGKALYFSRSRVPFKREPTAKAQAVPYYHHCGIYGYKKQALEKFVSLPPSRLEKLEKLEQLRALENGLVIKAVEIEPAGPAIDTEDDLKRAEIYLQEHCK